MNTDLNYREYLPRLVKEEAKPLHKYGHQARLYELTSQIGAGIAYDDEVVFAAVWLHDLGVFEGNRPSDPVELQQWDHVRYAVRRTREILAGTDFPADKIGHVVAVIEEHQPKDMPSSTEAFIVRDADILEQLGATAILRTATKLGSDTRFLYFADAKNYLERQLNELPGKLQLSRSRELALPRQAILRDFLSSLEDEAGDRLG